LADASDPYLSGELNTARWELRQRNPTISRAACTRSEARSTPGSASRHTARGRRGRASRSGCSVPRLMADQGTRYRQKVAPERSGRARRQAPHRGLRPPTMRLLPWNWANASLPPGRAAAPDDARHSGRSDPAPTRAAGAWSPIGWVGRRSVSTWCATTRAWPAIGWGERISSA
jgi:hypothetical protein